MTVSDPAVLVDLLARVEAASGPSFALERDIHRALAPRAVLDAFADGTPVPADWGLRLVPPAYTASLDVALRLVSRALPGWSWMMRASFDDGVGQPFAKLWKPYATAPGNDYDAMAATPALAILAALLRALLSKASGAGQ